MKVNYCWSSLFGVTRLLVLTLGVILSFVGLTSAATPAAEVPSGPFQLKEAPYAPDELLVKFRAGVSDEKKSTLHAKQGGQKLKEYKELRLHRVKLKANDKVKDALKRYNADPEVEYAEPNFMVGLNATANDPMISALWGLTKIKAQEAWERGTGSSAVVVAVLDTGIDYNHVDLKDNLWINSLDPANGGDNDANGYADDIYGVNAISGGGNVLDDNGHGTHVAGTIGATGNNGTGVTGVNWAVKLLTCKMLNASGSGYVSDAVESLIYLKALKERTQDPVSIPVINASWAFSEYSFSLYDAIKAMGDTLFVAAAGNEGLNSEVNPYYPAAYRLPNVISVAATTSTDALAPFSNYGKHLVDVGAPGMDILSTWTNGGYVAASGTSMAAPHVSGLAALLKGQDPLRTGGQIRNLILSSGESLATLQGMTATGKRIDAAAATNCFDKWLLSPGRLPFPVSSGNSYTLTARSLNCAAAAGPVTVTTSAGQTVVLQDDGALPDAASGDGIFSANWTGGTFPVTLTFSSPAGTRTVTLPPLKASFHVADARVNVPYYQLLGVEGGVPPYSWTIQNGALPPGLSLDPATGVISGTASATAAIQFPAEVTDAEGNKASADISLRVVTESVDQSWGRVFGGDGNDEGRAVASDPSGNVYVSGKIYNGVNSDLFLSKYDPSGELLWTRTFDRGGNEAGYSVARDPDGNIYVAGYSIKIGYEVILLKYSAAGALLWSNASTLAAASMAHPAVAVDGEGNAFLVSAGYLQSNEAVRLEKFTPSGTRVWSKTHQDSNVNLANSVAIDPSGNIYFGGSRIRVGGYWDYLLAKYDPTGNLLWTKTVPEGVSSFIEGIAVDASGNLVAAGTTSTVSAAYGVTMKYDPNGNQLWKSATTTGHLLRGISVTAGGIYVTGELQASSATDFVTLKYDHAGSQIWKKTLNAGRRESAYGVAADAAGITVVGSGEYQDNSEALLARYSETTAAVADLAVTSFTASLTGSTVTYDLTVRNNGSGNATAAVGLYLSTDNVASSTDHPVTYLSAGNLPGGSEKRLSGSVVVPVAVPSGSYFVAAVADPGDVVLETDETNNGAVSAGTYAFSQAVSDLQITDLSGAVAAGSLSYSVTVANTGTLNTGASTTSLYLWSGGTVITLDNPVASLNTGAIAAGAQTVLTGSVPLPATAPQGTYYLLALADSNNAVSETNESNNGSTGNQVTLSNDLTISALSGTLSGGTLSYSVTVANQGNANANAPLSFYLSSDGVASSGDILIRQTTAGSIAGGSQKILTGSITIPTSVPPGTYYLAALADPANVVDEGSETNNGAVAQQFTFASDLQVPAFSATLAAGKLSYAVTVRNGGNLASTPAASAIYLSADETATPSDLRISSFIVTSVAAGAERVLRGTITVPMTTPAGTYWPAVIVDNSNLVLEANESNNSAVTSQISVANDISLDALTGSLSAGVLSYSVTLSNPGSGNLTAPVYLYFSPDASPSASDIVVKQIAPVSLAGGTSKVVTGTATVPATVPSGTYYLTAIADPAGAVVETSETNNGAAADQFTINSDLQVTALSASLAAGKLTYSMTVKNAGNIATSTSRTGLYLSADAAAAPSDLLVSAVYTPGIAVGGEKVLTGSVSIPAAVPPGTYYVAAIADSANILSESVEANNSAVGNQVTLSNDLAITALSGTLNAGILSYTVTLRNNGSGSTSTPVFIYLSPDAVASTDDIVVKQIPFSNIAGGTEKTMTGTVGVPGSVPSGSYNLAAVADPAGAVAESNETNNGAVAGSFTVAADLQVTAVSATLAGGRLTYSLTVTNAGNIATPSTITGLYFSTDATVSSADLPVASVSTTSIPFGAQKVITGSVSVPATVPMGSYYVAAIADTAGAASETIETNNGAAGNLVTLSNDLSITALSGTLSGGVLSYSMSVRNSGSGNPVVPIKLYFSPDAEASTDDLLLKDVSGGNIPGGTEKVFTGTVTVPGTIPSGSYYLAAVADPANLLPETGESNNGAVAAEISVATDLRVTALSATVAGGKMSYSLTVRNTGNISSATSPTGLYLSGDAVATGSDLQIASISTPVLAPGAEKVINGTATIPSSVGPGSYYVAALADLTNVNNESDESNNAAVGNQVALSNDLSITALSGTLGNGVLSYSVTVANTGNLNPTAQVQLGFSSDGVAGGDLQLKLLSSSIPGGTQKVFTGTVTVPGTIPSGSYYLAAVADPANLLPETGESNNGALAAEISVNTDLRVTALSATVAGGKISYSLTVRNAGNISSASSSIGLYLSSDAVATGSDLQVASVPAPVLAPGAEKVITGTATLPSSVGPGSYYVAAIADLTNVNYESDESNNAAVGNQLALSNDLSITSLSGSLSGGVFTYSVTVANTGNLNPVVPVSLALSRLGFATSIDYQLKLLSSNVPGGTEKVMTGTVTIPGTAPTGTFFLTALADPAGILVESSDGNNGAVGAQFTLNKDLRVTAVSGSVSAGTLNYSITVQNFGNVATESSSTGLYLSVDGTPAVSDYLVNSLSTASIPAGGTRTLTGRVALPTTIPAGTYYLAAIADAPGAVVESAEDNNAAVGGTVAR